MHYSVEKDFSNGEECAVKTSRNQEIHKTKTSVKVSSKKEGRRSLLSLSLFLHERFISKHDCINYFSSSLSST